MSRILGLPALLIALVIGGVLVAKDMKSNSPASPTVQQEIQQAQVNVAATNFQGADAQMGAIYAQAGTYVDATLPAGFGVVLIRADATSYCLQTTTGSEHEVGPGGQAQPGSC